MLLHLSVGNAISSFSELRPYNVDFDIIRLSYYPSFSKRDLNLVKSKLNELATVFDKDILLVEVVYPFSLERDEHSSKFIAETIQVLTEFPATPSGQKAYFEWLVSAIKSIPNNKVIGFCYWAPDWIAFDGNEETSTAGSAWENQCLFNFDHKALPVFEVFKFN